MPARDPWWRRPGPAQRGPGSGDGPDAARARLTSELQHSQAISPAVLAAFASVPRHLFVPELGAAEAYRDEAVVIKCGPDGQPVSSSSQPAMMAIMAGQLGLEPGHRVLEIGTGTGYNAAVLATVTGPGGEVVTVDIDPELTGRARASLDAAGFGDVRVECADGGYGDPAGAPFDRIIVTAGAWDIAPAWLGQLGPGGRLVLPLSVRGIQLSVGFERVGDAWRTTSACRCGFVRMLGAFAGPEEVTQLAGPEPLGFQVSDGDAVDAAALCAALGGDEVSEPVPVPLAGAGEAADLDLWLTLTAGSLSRLTVLSAPGAPFGALASDPADAGQFGLARLSGSDWTSPAEADSESAPVIRGSGPGGPALARRLAGLSERWAQRGRPGAGDLQMLAWPAGGQPEAPPGMTVFTRPSVTLAAGWPAAG